MAHFGLVTQLRDSRPPALQSFRPQVSGFFPVVRVTPVLLHAIIDFEMITTEWEIPGV
jgi:hypothetical protein